MKNYELRHHLDALRRAADKLPDDLDIKRAGVVLPDPSDLCDTPGFIELEKMENLCQANKAVGGTAVGLCIGRTRTAYSINVDGVTIIKYESVGDTLSTGAADDE